MTWSGPRSNFIPKLVILKRFFKKKGRSRHRCREAGARFSESSRTERALSWRQAGLSIENPQSWQELFLLSVSNPSAFSRPANRALQDFSFSVVEDSR